MIKSEIKSEIKIKIKIKIKSVGLEASSSANCDRARKQIGDSPLSPFAPRKDARQSKIPFAERKATMNPQLMLPFALVIKRRRQRL